MARPCGAGGRALVSRGAPERTGCYAPPVVTHGGAQDRPGLPGGAVGAVEGDLPGAGASGAGLDLRSDPRTETLLRRVQLGADISYELAASLDLDVTLERLARRLVPDLGDLCVVDLCDGIGSRSLVAVAARTAEPERLMRAAEARLPRRHNPASSLARTLATAAPTLVADCDDAYLAEVSPDEAVCSLYRAIRMRSLLVVPLLARGSVLGAITLVRTEPYPSGCYDEPDVEVASEIAARAALAVDNARLYTGEHAAAEALQRALLPAIEAQPGIAVAARYQPASAGVGGDWYDLFAVPDGAVSITIGDVAGHDLRAAASMGQLRSVIRSYATEVAQPAEVLDRADRLVQSFSMARLATAFYARLERPAPGRRTAWRLSYANAGHPPPLLHLPDGSLRWLEGATGPPIGAPRSALRPDATVDLEAGTTFVGFTDGLVERRERDLDVGLRRLEELVGAGEWLAAGEAPAVRLEALCELLTGRLLDPDRSDDVAVLALTLG